MLTHLSIKNFAVVRSLDVELHQGLTTITGETGAGKSIMLDALGLVLGDRANTGVIRDGMERAEVSASFEIAKPKQPKRKKMLKQKKPIMSETETWLQDNGFSSDECILRRTISQDGRSRAYINGTPVTLAQIKALGESLVDIHNQHEHQSLLRKASHRLLLDNYAGAAELSQQVENTYQAWRTALKSLEQLTQEAKSRQDQHELLSYHLAELDELDLKTDELEQLEAEQNRLSQADSIISQGQQVLSLCSGDGGSSDSIADAQHCNALLSQAIKISQGIQDTSPDLNNSRELLETAEIHLNEATTSLQSYLDSIIADPQRQQEVEQRLDAAYQLARKHKIQATELESLHHDLTQQLQQLEQSEGDLVQLQQAVTQYSDQFIELAQQLSKMRQTASGEFSQQVTDQLQMLGMAGSQFSVALEPLAQDQPSARGLETVEFLVSTNAGQSPRPLAKIASGGELSRISLAIQVITAQTTQIPTLIFDEVDVGIGGATAEIVGDMLRRLGDAGQVICVTHQPQVAAKSHHHLVVSKHTNDEGSNSLVEQLSDAEKVSEIARMLGGVKLTEQTLAHAKEMLLETD